MRTTGLRKGETMETKQMTDDDAREVVKWTQTEDAKLWHEALEQEALWTDGPYEWYSALDKLMYV